MKKHVMLGVYSPGNTCCVLICLLPFDKLEPDDLEPSDFRHYSTNWCGCDSIERTLELRHLSLTGREFKLKKPLQFHGEDHDCGHVYPWTMLVDTIKEVQVDEDQNSKV